MLLCCEIQFKGQVFLVVAIDPTRVTYALTTRHQTSNESQLKCLLGAIFSAGDVCLLQIRFSSLSITKLVL